MRGDSGRADRPGDGLHDRVRNMVGSQRGCHLVLVAAVWQDRANGPAHGSKGVLCLLTAGADRAEGNRPANPLPPGTGPI